MGYYTAKNTGIRVPTFPGHAEWDATLPSCMLHAYFAKLTNTAYKRYVEIGEGTHSIMVEKNRMHLFQAVQRFFDEQLEPKTQVGGGVDLRARRATPQQTVDQR